MLSNIVLIIYFVPKTFKKSEALQFPRTPFWKFKNPLFQFFSAVVWQRVKSLIDFRGADSCGKTAFPTMYSSPSPAFQADFCIDFHVLRASFKKSLFVSPYKYSTYDQKGDFYFISHK